MSKPRNDRRIDYIEFAVSDIERSREFYGKTFGWTFKDYGPAYCEFSDGRLTGGFAKGDPVAPGGPLVILFADDLADTQRRAGTPADRRDGAGATASADEAASGVARHRGDRQAGPSLPMLRWSHGHH